MMKQLKNHTFQIPDVKDVCLKSQPINGSKLGVPTNPQFCVRSPMILTQAWHSVPDSLEPLTKPGTSGRV